MYFTGRYNRIYIVIKELIWATLSIKLGLICRIVGWLPIFNKKIHTWLAEKEKTWELNNLNNLLPILHGCGLWSSQLRVESLLGIIVSFWKSTIDKPGVEQKIVEASARATAALPRLLALLQGRHHGQLERLVQLTHVDEAKVTHEVARFKRVPRVWQVTRNTGLPSIFVRIT